MSDTNLLAGAEGAEVERIACAFLEAIHALLSFGTGNRSDPRVVMTAAAKAMVFGLAGIVAHPDSPPAGDALNLAAVDELLRSTVADMRSEQ